MAHDFNLNNFYNNVIRGNGDSLLYSYQFVARFDGLATIDQSLADALCGDNSTANFSYLMQSANIPGVELKPVSTNYFGTQFRLPGTVSYNHTWTTNVILKNDIGVYKAFRYWQRLMSDIKYNGGGDKRIGDVRLKLGVLNQDCTSIVRTVNLEGIWVKSVGDIQLKYENGGGNPINSFPIEFRYQYNYEGDDKDNPLSVSYTK